MATVLVVDDNLDICRAMGRLVRRAGYDAEWVNGGAEAMARLNTQSSPPDLIILDEMMPEMDGIAVLRAIRRNAATSKTPVIMFTAVFDDAFFKLAITTGASDVWIKGSFDLGRLAEELSRYVPATH